MPQPQTNEWQPVFINDCSTDYVERMKVPGGWIYRSFLTGDSDGSQSMVFVPEPRK